MKAFLLLVTACATASSVEAGLLKCRRCIGAASLDECTFSVPCSSDEDQKVVASVTRLLYLTWTKLSLKYNICYMDMVVTEQLSVEYNGGCRPRVVCSKSAAVVGKRAGTYIACSGCCDMQATPECNTKICGIKSSMAGTNQCYSCASNGGQGTAVNDPNKCTPLSSCQSDQMCGAETFVLGGSKTYEFKCLPKMICTLLTKEALKRRDECMRSSNPDVCGMTGRRATGTKICTACCGDSQCNSESCDDIIDRLYNLWKGGVLDLNTLTVNGTLPATRPAIYSTSGYTSRVTVSG